MECTGVRRMPRHKMEATRVRHMHVGDTFWIAESMFMLDSEGRGYVSGLARDDTGKVKVVRRDNGYYVYLDAAETERWPVGVNPHLQPLRVRKIYGVDC